MSAELSCATTVLSCRFVNLYDRRAMRVEKSNLVAMLLEAGEENAAVLLARSQLPDELDTDRDSDTLVSFGLDRDQVDEIARLTIGAIESDGVNVRRRRDELEKTISRRWADLVDDWTA
jgi:hypothetical protein